MSDTGSPVNTILILLDESAAMQAPMPETSKTKKDIVATCVNSLLHQLGARPELFVGVVGYRSDAAGAVDIGFRWGGPLTGRQFIAVSELASCPTRVEQRTRKIYAPGGFIVAHEESVEFPVWYDPTCDQGAPLVAAFDFCAKILDDQSAGGNRGRAAVFHVTASRFVEGATVAAVRLQEAQASAGSPLVFHASLAPSNLVPATLYPTNVSYVPAGVAKDLFQGSSALPSSLLTALKGNKIPVLAGAHGMVYAARMGDLVGFLGLIKDLDVKLTGAMHANAPLSDAPVQQTSAASAAGSTDSSSVSDDVESQAGKVEATGGTTTPRDDAATRATNDRLIAFIVDLSSDNPEKPYAPPKLEDHTNRLLAELSHDEPLPVDVMLFTYGTGDNGEPIVTDVFASRSPGRSEVSACQLHDAAIRIDESEERVSDGVGGLMIRSVKRPVFLDVPATAAADPVPVFRELAQSIATWMQSRRSNISPVVMHLTRGRYKQGRLEEAVRALKELSEPVGVVLYHLVVTEFGHPAVAYPFDDGKISDDGVRDIWRLSSTLQSADRLAEHRSSLTSESKGLVVNGRFDLLRASLEEISVAVI